MTTNEHYAVIDVGILNENLQRFGICKACKKGSLIFETENVLALSVCILSMVITLNAG